MIYIVDAAAESMSPPVNSAEELMRIQGHISIKLEIFVVASSRLGCSRNRKCENKGVRIVMSTAHPQQCSL